jgi:hypothetical protein
MRMAAQDRPAAGHHYPVVASRFALDWHQLGGQVLQFPFGDVDKTSDPFAVQTIREARVSQASGADWARSSDIPDS